MGPSVHISQQGSCCGRATGDEVRGIMGLNHPGPVPYRRLDLNSEEM